MSIPSWVPEAVFYQIFPDRFARGAAGAPAPDCQPWGSKPTVAGFQGGDLPGIQNRLDYLVDLGINAIYLNPIFLSPSTHRYNTYDYYRIDTRLGSLKDFRSLLRTAHRRGIRVVLDGVFNHCGRGFYPFHDLLENQRASAYRNWFHVKKYPVDAYSEGQATSYAAWWGYKSLPKFNTDEPAVRKYLLDVARYWVKEGIDGWRLDVPNEIDDDSFWAEFRQVVTRSNPDAYLVGEIWDVLPRWVGEDHFHGLMNYPLREAVLDWLTGQIQSDAFIRRALHIWSAYPEQNRLAMYNLLGSHDRERLLTLLGGNVSRAVLGYQFLFAFPGIPAVYYGDEVGLLGGKDPDCRAAFPWDQSQWNQPLRRTIQALIAARKSVPALQYGDLQSVRAEIQDGVSVFLRKSMDDQIICAFNCSSQPRRVHISLADSRWPEGTIVRNLIGPGEWLVGPDGFEIRLDRWSGVWLRQA